MSFPLAPPPTKLGHYRQFALCAAIHVSPLALGAMSIGDQWGKFGMGAMDKERSRLSCWTRISKAGVNMCRGQFVNATKYTNYGKARDEENITRRSMYMDNNAKSLKRLNIEESLRRRTSYIDVFYVHYWDLHTSVEEMMDALHILVLAGTVLYLFVVKANEYANFKGQWKDTAAYSVTQRDIEREILPMCRHKGIALTVFNVLAVGHIRTDAEEEERRATGEHGHTLLGGWERTPDEKKMCAALEVVAKQVGATHTTAVAIAYTMHKAPFVFPIVGGRKIAQRMANIEALDISLTPEHIAYLDGVLPFAKGFPSSMLGEYGGLYPFLMTLYETYDRQPLLPPVTPA
ncbi:aryl-alcohol dehydrogenase [Mycena crocata]|nr:aryl-alcohol dehydrogenase [Mycena crocata]